MSASAKGFPIICKPIGKPFSEKPQGTLTAGIPARLTLMVNKSFRYIAKGSSILSPNLNAGVGVVGVSKASTDSNTFVKSSETQKDKEGIEDGEEV